MRHFCECITSTSFVTALIDVSQKQDLAAQMLEVCVSPLGMLHGRLHWNPNFPENSVRKEL